MIARPILRPMWCLRAVCRITASLTGKTDPARSRAILNAGHSVMSDTLAAEVAAERFTFPLRALPPLSSLALARSPALPAGGASSLTLVGLLGGQLGQVQLH